MTPARPGDDLLAVGFGAASSRSPRQSCTTSTRNRAVIASALLNSAQTIGAPLGLAVLARIGATVTGGWPDAPPPAGALVEGYDASLAITAGTLLVAVSTLTSR
jgi:hypothetical protein